MCVLPRVRPVDRPGRSSNAHLPVLTWGPSPFPQDELRAQLHRQIITGANTFLSQLSTIGGPIVTFIWYSQVQGETLTAAKVFSALSWFNLLQRPLSLLPAAVTAIMDCQVSIERLEAFFDAADALDEDGEAGGAASVSVAAASGATSSSRAASAAPSAPPSVTRKLSFSAGLSSHAPPICALPNGSVELNSLSVGWGDAKAGDALPVLS